MLSQCLAQSKYPRNAIIIITIILMAPTHDQLHKAREIYITLRY